MKWTEIRNLRKGDWIITRELENGKFVGKFKIGRVNKIEVKLENYEELDINKGNIEAWGSGLFTGIDGGIWTLNRKEVKALSILRTKLKTLKGLDDKRIKKVY